MSTAIIEKQEPVEATIRFSVTIETARPMIAKYMALRIDDVNDKALIEVIRKARQEVRKARTTVDAERKAAGEEYRKIVSAINATAATITDELEPAEAHLVGLLDWVDRENQRIADEKLDARLNHRLHDLDEVGGIPSAIAKDFEVDTVVRSMTDERFKDFVRDCDATNKRLQIEAQQRAEAEAKLAEERAELDRLRKAESERQKAEQARLDEERRKESERLAAERAAERKKLDDEAAERRRIAAEEQAKHDAEMNERRRVAAEEHRKLEAQREVQRQEQAKIDAERKKLADEREAKVRAEEEALAEKQRLANAETSRIEAEKLKAESAPARQKIIAYRDALLTVAAPTLAGRFAKSAPIIAELREMIGERLTTLAASLEKNGAKR